MLTSRGTYETSMLMRGAGLSVNMNYGYDASGADTEDAYDALKADFSYQADWVNYSGNSGAYLRVKNSLGQGRPVILRGKANQSSFLFVSWPSGAGHAWVCDGYQSTTVSSSASAYSYLWFRMNWGWDGTANGLFTFTNWTVQTGSGPLNFQYGQNAIVDIHP